jgi:hypothetical protein
MLTIICFRVFCIHSTFKSSAHLEPDKWFWENTVTFYYFSFETNLNDRPIYCLPCGCCYMI